MPLQLPTRLALAVGVLTICSSCGSNMPHTSCVSGVVVLDGKPLTGFDKGSVVLTPSNGRLAVGELNAQTGTFELGTFSTGDGAIVGPAKVAVIAIKETTRSSVDDRYAAVRSILPEHFSDRDNSGLECEVKPGDANVFRIVLSTDGSGKIETQ